MTALLDGGAGRVVLSHTSTLAILFAATVTTAVLFWWRGGPSLRSPAAAIALATTAAAVLAVVAYYAHFMDTYRAELGRIGHETATAAADAGGRTIGDRLKLVPYSLGMYIGAPVLLFAFLGGVELALRRTTRSPHAHAQRLAALVRGVSRHRRPDAGRHAALPRRDPGPRDCGRLRRRLGVVRGLAALPHPVARHGRDLSRRHRLDRVPQLVECARMKSS